MALDQLLRGRARTTSGEERAGEDWAARATKLVATGVELVRDKSVRPAYLVATGIVIALAVAGTVVATIVLVAVGMARLFNALVFQDHMWATYSLVGGIFLVAGVFLLAVGRRTPSGDI